MHILKPIVSNRYLLKRMMLEDREIQELQEWGVSFCPLQVLLPAKRYQGCIHNIESGMQGGLWRLRLLAGDINSGQHGAGLRHSWALARESGLLLGVAHVDGTRQASEELSQAERLRPCERP